LNDAASSLFFNGSPSNNGRERFGKNAAHTFPVIAKELAGGEFDPDGVSLPRQVEQFPCVARVNPVGFAFVNWTVYFRACCPNGENDCAVTDAECVEREAVRVGKQGWASHTAILPAESTKRATNLHQIHG
jgi:hypothetical protein